MNLEQSIFPYFTHVLNTLLSRNISVKLEWALHLLVLITTRRRWLFWVFLSLNEFSLSWYFTLKFATVNLLFVVGPVKCVFSWLHLHLDKMALSHQRWTWHNFRSWYTFHVCCFQLSSKFDETWSLCVVCVVCCIDIFRSVCLLLLSSLYDTVLLYSVFCGSCVWLFAVVQCSHSTVGTRCITEIHKLPHTQTRTLPESRERESRISTNTFPCATRWKMQIISTCISKTTVCLYSGKKNQEQERNDSFYTLDISQKRALFTLHIAYVNRLWNLMRKTILIDDERAGGRKKNRTVVWNYELFSSLIDR